MDAAGPKGRPAPASIDKDALDNERYELLERLDDLVEPWMVFLAIIWLALLVMDLVWGLSLSFQVIGTTIWAVFILHFLLDLLLAPHKAAFLKSNWLTVLSLFVPALRIFRIFRIIRLLPLARVSRGLRLFRVVSSLNRGMRSLAAHLQRRRFGYILSLTVLVIFAGAAGMYAFENQVPGGLKNYGDALWWTAMIMTTMGSQYWPQTFEGRVLCFLLAVYAFAVFGYVTATLATFFIGRDAENEEGEVAGSEDLQALRSEIGALREEMRTLLDRG